MPTITRTISAANFERIKEACEGNEPIPLDEITGLPLFTPGQWAKEAGRRFYIAQVFIHERRLEREASAISKDDSLLS